MTILFEGVMVGALIQAYLFFTIYAFGYLWTKGKIRAEEEE